MKHKIFFVLVIALCFCASALASPSGDEVNVLNNKLIDARYRIDAGINYKEFHALATDIYVDSQKFYDKYPGEEITTRLKMVTRLYKIGDVNWHKSIFNKYKELVMHEKIELITYYPDIANGVHKINGEWYPEPVRDAVIFAIPKLQRDLNKYIAETYKN